MLNTALSLSWKYILFHNCFYMIPEINGEEVLDMPKHSTPDCIRDPHRGLIKWQVETLPWSENLHYVWLLF